MILEGRVYPSIVSGVLLHVQLPACPVIPGF